MLISKEFANFSSKISNLNANKIENAHFCHKLKIIMKFDYYQIKYDYLLSKSAKTDDYLIIINSFAKNKCIFHN